MCNRLLLAETGERLASAFIGVLDPQTRTLEYVSAGHAPPLLRLPDRRIEVLEQPSVPLGVQHDARFEAFRRSFEPGSMLVLYTDGVIEITRDVIAGERMLGDVLASDAIVRMGNPAEFIERAIANEAPHDDIAILVLDFGQTEANWQFEAADARAAYTMREEFFRLLSRTCNAGSSEISTCGLIFAELIGNAVRHAPGPIGISLEFQGEDVILHVVDKGPGFQYDPHLPADVWSESGRGLFLVSKLAKHVRADRIPGLGAHIAVTLPVRRR
jgi:anti-sigma regulatory factor (Ser/Thr protein kinase)